jgi:CAAX protease family protein
MSEQMNAPAVLPSIGWRERLLSVLYMVLIYYGIQGLTLVFRISKLFFTPEQLQQHPWIWLDEHHVWQMMFALVAIGYFSRSRYSDWGLNFRNQELSWRIFAWFVPVCLALLFVFDALPYLTKHQAPDFDFPVTYANVVGWLSFQWLLPGPSEEILFRGLIHTYLAQTWMGIWQIGKFSMPTVGILATLVFCLGHVNPLHAPHVIWSEQFWAFALGIYYSAVYHRTGSLLTPILSHNFWDGIVFAAWFLLYWRFH